MIDESTYTDGKDEKKIETVQMPAGYKTNYNVKEFAIFCFRNYLHKIYLGTYC
jgi:hypothetical protein